MARIIKLFLPFALLCSTELIFYFILSDNQGFRLDSFFFGWGAIWLMFLVFSIRGSSSRSVNFSSSVGMMNQDGLAGVRAEIEMQAAAKHHVPAFMTSINFFYLMLLILNIFGYLLTLI